MSFNWVCPHCSHAQTVVKERFDLETNHIGVGDLAEGSIVLEKKAIACANSKCKKLTLRIRVGQDRGFSGWEIDNKKVLFSRQVLPEGVARPQPDYIPEPLREDYYEACLIRDLSPKASATLTRRCLQGMIRNFCDISKPRLIEEIKALKKSVADGTADRAITEESVHAIDQVRSLGNIGAHMEADINQIVPVDPGEAQAMIELVELLFDEWYGARQRRQEKLARISEIKIEKDQIKDGEKSPLMVPTLDIPQPDGSIQSPAAAKS